ncbi:MAG: SDR family NAD(P)-dependent oxidoreductase [Anaerolineae bacterium]
MKGKVLITGGAGFIGSYTAEALIHDGYEVRVLDNLDPQIHGGERRVPDYLHPDVEFMYGDVRDREAVVAALQGVDVVYHFAALTGVTQSMYEVARYVDVNVAGTATVWDAIVNEKLPVRRFVLSSSRAVYGEGSYLCATCHKEVYPSPRPEAQLSHGDWEMHCPQCHAPMEAAPTREDKPLQPLSVYAQSKLFQENISRMMAESYGVPTVVLRYFNVYGPRQALSNPYTGIAPVFCTRIRNGNPVDIYEDGLPVRDFVHVSDIARANLLAAADLEDGYVVANVGSGVRLTVLDMAQAICRYMKEECQLQFSGRFRAGDIRSCYADIDTARRVLGFEPTVSFDWGVADLIRWVLHQEQPDDAYEASVGNLEGKGLVKQTAVAMANGYAR